MFTVQSRFFETMNKGTQHENKKAEYYWRNNGPFATRDSAEGFARGLATQSDICQVRIVEEADEEADA